MDHIDCVVVVAVAFSVLTFVALTVSHSGSSDLRIGRLPTNVTALPSKIKRYINDYKQSLDSLNA